MAGVAEYAGGDPPEGDRPVSTKCWDCGAPAEWNLEGMDDFGKVLDSLPACGDGEDLFQAVVELDAHEGVVSVSVYRWIG